MRRRILLAILSITALDQIVPIVEDPDGLAGIA